MQPDTVPPGELSPVHTPRDEWAIETMVCQRGVVRELEERAEAASTGEATCTLWAAVERQADRYHRHLDPWGELGGFQRSLAEIGDHRDSLERSVKRARIEQRRFDDGVRDACGGRLGIRVAVIGKGGAGKTLIASTLARMLARQGRRVLAADLDTCPGLTMSLEVPDAELGLPVGVVEQHAGGNYGWHLAADARPVDVVTTCSVAGADGVRLLGIGKIVAFDKVIARRSSSAIVQLLLGFGEPGWDVIADLEAGVTTPFERYHAFADDVLLVVGPGRSSGMAARRWSGPDD